MWRPPPAPPRDEPTGSPPLRVLPVDGSGPEDVVVDEAGRVVTGLADGRVVRLDSGSGRVNVLAAEFAGEPLRFCNNAAVGADGTIWFTDSSRRFGIEHWRADLLEHSGTGRLLRRDPSGAVDVALDGLQMANGVALAADGAWVAVAETGAYRVTRLWVTGPAAGSVDVLVDLPAFPDNLSTGPTGLIWIALASPRNALLDRLHRAPPVLRRALWALPVGLQPQPVRTAWALAVDGAGRTVHDLRTGGPDYSFVTGVRELDGRLWLSSLTGTALAVLDLPG